MIIVSRAVNFGATKGSLSTVGYALKNFDGSIKQDRTTVGIVEIVAGKGVYGASISFEDGWSGFIIWDTGEATPLYAVDQFDYRQYAVVGAIYSSGGGSSESYKEDFQRLTRLINKVLKAVNALPDPSKSVNESAEKVIFDGKTREERILEAIKVKDPAIEELKETLEIVGQALETLIENEEFKKTIKEIEHA